MNDRNVKTSVTPSVGGPVTDTGGDAVRLKAGSSLLRERKMMAEEIGDFIWSDLESHRTTPPTNS